MAKLKKDTFVNDKWWITEYPDFNDFIQQKLIDKCNREGCQ